MMKAKNITSFYLGKIKRKFKLIISTQVLKFSVRYNFIGLTSLLLRFHIEPIRNVTADSDSKSFHILILPKPGFTEDILDSLSRRDVFKIYELDRRLIKTIYKEFLPYYVDDNNYCQSDLSLEEKKQELRKFWIIIIRLILRKAKIDAVISGNFAYASEKELAGAFNEIGIPFVILHKENMKSSGRVAFFKEIYSKRRGPFFGSRILVYNEIEKDLQIDSGIIAGDKVTITGMPRLDRVYRWRERQSELAERTLETKNQVLFFSFGPKTGLPMIPHKSRSAREIEYEELPSQWDDLRWQDLVIETHRAIFRLAQEYPQIKVIIKAKGGKRQSSDVYQILQNMGNIPSNLEVIVGGDPFKLITHSNVVCGFNTTGLLEAIAAGKPVVVPWFAEALDEEMKPYIVDLEDAVEYAHSSQNLVDRLSAYALKPGSPVENLSQAAMKMLNKWVGNSDGLAGERVRKALLNEMQLEK